MKTHHRLQHSVLTHLALVAGLGVLTSGPDWQFAGASAFPQDKPVFSEIPGLTPPAQPPAVTNVQNKPVFSEIPSLTSPPPARVATNAPPVPPPAPIVLFQQPAPPPREDDTKNKTVYSFQASELDLRTALATFAKANNLNIVPDNDVAGTVTLDVRDLPLGSMMRALLEASDCTWNEQGGLIRVHATESRIFNIDYLRLSRKGLGLNTATLGSGSTGGGGAGSAGGGGSVGGGATGGSGGAGTINSGSSSIHITANNVVDFWTELSDELKSMLTPAGQSSLSMNKTAGIIQITDRPSALKKVENYLTGVRDNSHRQVDIEAKLYDVTLNNQFQFGIDWVHIAEAYGGALAFGGATLPVANGGAQLLDSAVNGIARQNLIGSSTGSGPGSNPNALVFKNMNTVAAVNALQQQGLVEVISTPRLRTMNNQTALIKVGEEVPFFSTSVNYVPGTSTGSTIPLQQSTVTSITIGTILSITPQISSDDWVSLDISPVLTSLKAIVIQPGSGSGIGGGIGAGSGSSGGSTTAPDLDTKQASSLVRVRDGETIVMGGLIQTTRATNDTKVPIIGEIPLIGKLFTGTFRYNQKKELVIFVTPHIVRDGAERPLPDIKGN